MSRLIRLTLVFVILLAALPVLPAAAQSLPPPLRLAVNLRITMVNSGSFACRATGMVTWSSMLTATSSLPVEGIPWDQLVLPDGTNIPVIVTPGLCLCNTSYSVNGLAVIKDCRGKPPGDQFQDKSPETNHTYLVGASEGGLITALAVERFPTVFSGGWRPAALLETFASRSTTGATFE